MKDDFKGEAPLCPLAGSEDDCWQVLPSWPRRWTCAVVLGGAMQAAQAQAPATSDQAADVPGATQRVEITGRAEKRIGNAMTVSEGSVSGKELQVRPLLRTAELLEVMPGLIAAQHSGGGKANQYFLRGFNLDHGTDFSLLVDQVPMNMRTHGHGQGYLDVGGVIPEVVNRIDYRKGPYRADAGDFSLVGMATIQTADSFERPFGKVEIGRFGYRRAVAGASWQAGDDDYLLAAEHKRYDGPWRLPERLDHSSLYLKGSHDVGAGTLRASLSVYHARWRPTEQIPERAIGTVLPDEFGSVDPALKGHTDRAVLALTFDSDTWRASAYAQHYDWKLLSNFTFFLDDPEQGDELEQVDRRRIFGGRLERQFRVSDSWRGSLGVEARFDDVPRVGLYKAVGGVRQAPRAVSSVRELSAALYGETRWAASPRVEVLAGLRADRYSFETHALEGGAWSGRVTDSQLSPKLGATFRVNPNMALYANWGRGFHSNDARGVTSPANPAPGLVPGTGAEIGARVEGKTFNFSATLWRMRVKSDLIYVGDSGAVEPSDATRRKGYEASLYWKPVPWLAMDANWTASHARFVGVPVGSDHVPGALESTGDLGVAAILDDWEAAIRVRHLGPHALVEDNSVRSDGTTLVNLRAARSFSVRGRKDLEVSIELLNALGSRRKDVDYYYASRLPGEPAEGVEGLHSRAVEPRSLRVGVKLSF